MYHQHELASRAKLRKHEPRGQGNHLASFFSRAGLWGDIDFLCSLPCCFPKKDEGV